MEEKIKIKNIRCIYCGGTDFRLGVAKELQYYRCCNISCRERELNVGLKTLRLQDNFWKEAQKQLLKELSNEFQPDVRTGVIYNENLNGWIQNKLFKIENEK